MDSIISANFASAANGVAKFLKDKGYAKRGLVFSKSNDRKKIVALQKSPANVRRHHYMTFFVKAGVVVPAIGRLTDPHLKDAQMGITDALWHWQIRDKLRDQPDWQIDETTDVKSLTDRLTAELSLALEHMEKYPEDRELLRQILVGECVPRGSQFYASQCAVCLAHGLGDAEGIVRAENMLRRNAGESPGFALAEFLGRWGSGNSCNARLDE